MARKEAHAICVMCLIKWKAEALKKALQKALRKVRLRVKLKAKIKWLSLSRNSSIKAVWMMSSGHLKMKCTAIS